MSLVLYILALLAIGAVVCIAALGYVRVKRQLQKPADSRTEVLLRSQIEAALRERPNQAD